MNGRGLSVCAAGAGQRTVVDFAFLTKADELNSHAKCYAFRVWHSWQMHWCLQLFIIW